MSPLFQGYVDTFVGYKKDKQRTGGIGNQHRGGERSKNRNQPRAMSLSAVDLRLSPRINRK